MHIPDGFLSPPVWVTLDALALPAVGYVARRVRTSGGSPAPGIADERNPQRETGHHRIPLMGVMGAFIFAAQMITFPVAAGTSGHLIGGTLLAVTLGPGAAAIVMTAILALQALIFQDGGVLSLGANVFNMALAGVAAGYLPSRLWGRTPRAIFAGGVLSVSVSAMLALAELMASGVAIPGHLLAASLGVFLINGMVEGAITVTAFRSLARLQPASTPLPGGRRLLAGTALAAVLLASCGALLASASPDGLQRLVTDLALIVAGPVWENAPLAGYMWGPGNVAGPDWVRQAGAGLLGVGMIFVLCLAGGRLLTGRSWTRPGSR